MWEEGPQVAFWHLSLLLNLVGEDREGCGLVCRTLPFCIAGGGWWAGPSLFCAGWIGGGNPIYLTGQGWVGTLPPCTGQGGVRTRPLYYCIYGVGWGPYLSALDDVVQHLAASVGHGRLPVQTDEAVADLLHLGPPRLRRDLCNATTRALRRCLRPRSYGTQREQIKEHIVANGSVHTALQATSKVLLTNLRASLLVRPV